MALTLDIFNSSAFSLRELTDAINVIPNQYDLVGKLGIFRDAGVTVPSLQIEEKNGILNMLAPQVRGGPPPVNVSGKRKVRSFAVPHIPLQEAVLAQEVLGVRAFGTESDLQTVSGRLQEKLEDIRAKHDITREFMMAGALKGVLVGGDGATIYNYFTEFGITQYTLDFALGTAGTDISGKCMAVKRNIEQNLKGETMSGIMVLCGDTWYDKFISHANVKEAFKYFLNLNQTLAGDYRRGFSFSNLTFVNYTSSVTQSDGTTATTIIPLTEAYAFPLGTRNTFKTYNAPAGFVETVNTIGLPYYAKQERMEFDMGIKVHTEMNPLPICLRPGVLAKLTTSN